jgi:roadblock/LC7 domain-containing protein
MEHRKLPLSLLVGAVLGSIRAIDFSPDGRFVAYGTDSGWVTMARR